MTAAVTRGRDCDLGIAVTTTAYYWVGEWTGNYRAVVLSLLRIEEVKLASTLVELRLPRNCKHRLNSGELLASRWGSTTAGSSLPY